MKLSQFKKIKDGRIDHLRRHMFDPELTPKQRQALRREVRRREKMDNQRQLDRQIVNRINASIRASVTPQMARVTAMRYKNAMTPNQRRDLESQVTRAAKNAERQYVKQFMRTGNATALLASLRALKRTVASTRHAIGK
jgi:predicted nucleic acid-binding OB-fold protein